MAATEKRRGSARASQDTRRTPERRTESLASSLAAEGHVRMPRTSQRPNLRWRSSACSEMSLRRKVNASREICSVGRRTRRPSQTSKVTLGDRGTANGHCFSRRSGKRSRKLFPVCSQTRYAAGVRSIDGVTQDKYRTNTLSGSAGRARVSQSDEHRHDELHRQLSTRLGVSLLSTSPSSCPPVDSDLAARDDLGEWSH